MSIHQLTTSTLIAVLFLAGCTNTTTQAEKEVVEVKETVIKELAIKNLLRDSLALADSVEVVMSYLEVPKNTTLPQHYHPGEEFIYMIEGSGELTIEGQDPRIVRAGDAIKIPYKHKHKFSSLDEDVRAIVFRVHEEGNPDRILVEE